MAARVAITGFSRMRRLGPCDHNVIKLDMKKYYRRKGHPLEFLG